MRRHLLIQKKEAATTQAGAKMGFDSWENPKILWSTGKKDSHQNNSETVCAVSSSVYVFFVDMLFDQIICAAAVAAVAADVT